MIYNKLLKSRTNVPNLPQNSDYKVSEFCTISTVGVILVSHARATTQFYGHKCQNPPKMLFLLVLFRDFLK